MTRANRGRPPLWRPRFAVRSGRLPPLRPDPRWHGLDERLVDEVPEAALQVEAAVGQQLHEQDPDELLGRVDEVRRVVGPAPPAGPARAAPSLIPYTVASRPFFSGGR